MRLKIRNLWNFDKHPHARDAYFDFLAPIALAPPLEKMTLSICGNKVAASLQCAGGVIKQLLLDWTSFQATVCPSRFINVLSILVTCLHF